MRALRTGIITTALMATLLAGCSSGGEDAATGSAATSAPAPSPTPTPTPAPVVWAGQVCVERQNVKAAVAALGRNLSYDVGSERSALDQIDRQVRLQVLAVGDALNGLGAAIADVPVDFVAANDFVVTATKAKDDTAQALDATRGHLDAMVNSSNVLTGVAEAGQALVAGKAAFEAGQALVGVVTDGASTTNAELQAAFDAAPQCQGAG